MKFIYPLIPKWKEYWNKNSPYWLRIACDVSIACLLETNKDKINFKSITSPNFFGCNWKGFSKEKRCHEEKNIDEIWVCHYMKPEDLFSMHQFLKIQKINKEK